MSLISTWLILNCFREIERDKSFSFSHPSLKLTGSAYSLVIRVFAISERERERKRDKANLLRINAAWPYHEPFVAPGYQYSLVRLNVKLCNYFISFISYLNKRNQLYMNEPLKQCLHMHTRQRIKLESIWLHRISSRQKHIFLFLFTVWLLSRSPNHVRHIESFMKKR